MSNSAWQEIRLANCDDGQFNRSLACQAWTNQLVTYIKDRLGISPRIRLHSYRSGKSTLLTIDASSSSRKVDVNITILLSESRIYLSAPADNQFDIELPGVVDALSLVESIFDCAHGVWDFAEA